MKAILKEKNLIYGYTQAALSAVGFGLMGFLGVFAYGEGQSTSSLLAWRFGIASLVFLAFSLHQGMLKNQSLKDLVLCFLLGIIGYTTHSLLFFNTIKHIDIGLATILLYTYPIFILVLSIFFNKQAVGKRQIVLVFFAFIGLLMAINLSGLELNSIGVLLGLSTAIAYSIYLKVAERLTKDLNPLVVSTFVCLGTFLSFLSIALYRDEFVFPSSPMSWILILTLSLFSTVGAILLLLSAIKRIGALKAAVISNLEPVTAIFLGAIFLSEKLSIIQIVGVVTLLYALSLLLKESGEE